MKRGRPKRPDKATPAQTSRASRIRSRLKNPNTRASVASDEIEYLRRHEAKYPYHKHANGNSVLEQLDAPSSRRTSSSTSSSSTEREPVLEQPTSPQPTSAPEQRFAVDFSEKPDPPRGEQTKPDDDDGGACPFGKECPHCRNGVAKKDHVLGKCGTTGRVVYEPMSEQGAKFFAGVVLNGMALAARVLRPDHALIEPEDEDYEDMTRGVRMTIDRRLPQLSAWDDLAQLGFAFGAFGRRAMFDPAPRALQSGERPPLKAVR